jgi:hypothetical protein
MVFYSEEGPDVSKLLRGYQAQRRQHGTWWQEVQPGTHSWLGGHFYFECSEGNLKAISLEPRKAMQSTEKKTWNYPRLLGWMKENGQE